MDGIDINGAGLCYDLAGEGPKTPVLWSMRWAAPWKAGTR